MEQDMTRATTPTVFDSAALPLLITLQEQGFELRVTNGALFIKPVDRVTLELRAQLRQHKPALMTLVCVCEQGVQDRVTVFRAQLEASPPRRSARSCSRRVCPTARGSASRAAPVCRRPASVAAGAARWRGGWPSVWDPGGAGDGV
mgnify:CR=1 FL=1